MLTYIKEKLHSIYFIYHASTISNTNIRKKILRPYFFITLGRKTYKTKSFKLLIENIEKHMLNLILNTNQYLKVNVISLDIILHK